MLEKLCKFIDSLNESIGRFSAWLILIMIITTFLVVIMRHGFDAGSIAMQEFITYLHAFAFMLAGAYTLKHNEHVRVDIFYHDMSERNKAIVNLVGSFFLLLPFAIFVVWISFDYVTNSWQVLEKSREAGGLPFVYLLKTLIPIMAILFLLQAISECARAWLILRK